MNTTDNFGVLLHEVARYWRAELDRRLRHLGLSQSQWLVLIKLPDEGMMQTALARKVGIEGSTLVRLLDRLQANGWIERRDMPGDRRAKRVVPTAKAKTLQHEVAVIAQALREQLLAGIDPQHVAIAAEVLSQLRQKLENLHD
ncbi:MarR family winged helix-turn-helix transcriptional regulator [Tepidiphilus margaritifer]|uniref:MarR family winged helix-turn-helix transcriptional regulator n=1 Tax=Tepidiphilus margaritifer TaxID=203471 RepID=UPI00048E6036|nr:MarR family transcriptional regulator [Tepidiphilus margaritifer]